MKIGNRSFDINEKETFVQNMIKFEELRISVKVEMEQNKTNKTKQIEINIPLYQMILTFYILVILTFNILVILIFYSGNFDFLHTGNFDFLHTRNVDILHTGNFDFLHTGNFDIFHQNKILKLPVY
jgi:hypothetical protein